MTVDWLAFGLVWCQGSLLSELRVVLGKQLSILRKGIEVHASKCATNMLPLHEHLEGECVSMCSHDDQAMVLTYASFMIVFTTTGRFTSMAALLLGLGVQYQVTPIDDLVVNSS